MWVVLFGFGTFFLNYATLVPVGEGMGLTTVTAGSILTIMMVAVVGVQPVASMLYSRFGPRHALGIALILQGISNIVGLVDGSPIAVLLTASIIGGLGFGVLVVSGTAVVPSTVVPSRLGRALGYFGATTAGATALGAPTGLWLIEVIPPVGLRWVRSEEHTSELQSRGHIVCRLLLEKKKRYDTIPTASHTQYV